MKYKYLKACKVLDFLVHEFLFMNQNFLKLGKTRKKRILKSVVFVNFYTRIVAINRKFLFLSTFQRNNLLFLT